MPEQSNATEMSIAIITPKAEIKFPDGMIDGINTIAESIATDAGAWGAKESALLLASVGEHMAQTDTWDADVYYAIAYRYCNTNACANRFSDPKVGWINRKKRSTAAVTALK
jgi:hypothetical protein